MALAIKLLRSPQSLTSFTSSSFPSRHYFCGRASKPLFNKCVTRIARRRLFSAYCGCKFTLPKFCFRKSFSSEGWLAVRNFFGVSTVFGSVSLWPSVSYALNGHDVLLDDYHVDLMVPSDTEEDRHALWTFARRFWLPAFLFLTVLVNWDSPIILTTKVILFLLTTKPSPLSVYVYVEKLCHQFVHPDPFFNIRKSLYAKKVEVQDYKLLCLATVEVSDQKYILVGILGGWWVFPSMLWENTLFLLRSNSLT